MGAACSVIGCSQASASASKNLQLVQELGPVLIHCHLRASIMGLLVNLLRLLHAFLAAAVRVQFAWYVLACILVALPLQGIPGNISLGLFLSPLHRALLARAARNMS